MTFGFGLTAALRALTASRYGMQVAGNNVANANTAGYSRQRVDLSASTPFGTFSNLQIGTGVDITGISRMFDDGLERRLQSQTGLVGAAQVDQQRMSEIESILGEPDNGLSSYYTDFFGAADQLRTNPSDRALRGGLIQAGTSLSQGFQLVSKRLHDLGSSTFDEVRGLVREVNQRIDTIANLNSQIVSAEATGATANDLRDTRGQQIKELSSLIDARAIERSSGSVDVLVGGHLLVAGDRATPLAAGKDANGKTQLTLGTNRASVTPQEGSIAALLRQEQSGLPDVSGRIDVLARQTILEWNRLHSTGMPASGPFHSLTSAYGSNDGNGNGNAGDELLSQSGLPFDVTTGDLYVSVTSSDTGQMQRTRIHIDPNSMSMQDVAAAINNIDHLSGSVDPTGHLRINSDAGYGFDFSPRLDPNPDGQGTFGGINPSIGSTGSGPYDLSGQTFPVSFTVTTGTAASPTVSTVTLNASDFSDPANATTDELVTAINNGLGTAGSASSVGGRITIQSSQGGSDSQVTLADSGGGTALGALGLSTATASGRDNAVTVAVEGTYTGSANNHFTFVAEGNGIVGQTADLRLRVLDQNGALVTTLNVGRDYEPGSPLSLGNGISVSIDAGAISGDNGQAFSLDALADSDTSDFLVATGTNAFFLGSSAADIQVNPELTSNPDRLAAGLGSAEGDSGNLTRLLALRDTDVKALNSNTIEDFYADVVGDVGFNTSAANSTLASQQQLLDQLQSDRDSVSGVNIDEEMVNLMSYQQSYDAAARLVSVSQQMMDTLINLGR